MTSPMTTPPHPTLAAGLTPTAARMARAHYARLAELSAYRHAHALNAHRYTAAARAEREYRRAARRCHALGQLMRIEVAEPIPVRELSAVLHAVAAYARAA